MDQHYHALLALWMKGDQAAQDFLLTLFTCLHVCDDLTDRDRAVSTEEVQGAFWKLLIELPRNPFYTRHFNLLNGALQVAFLNWQIANRLEDGHEDPNAKAVAFVLRESYTDLVTLSAWIVGGEAWAREVGLQSRLDAASEGMATYLETLSRERRTGGD